MGGIFGFWRILDPLERISLAASAMELMLKELEIPFEYILYNINLRM